MTVTARDVGEDSEPEFPVKELNELDKKISCARWIVPVLPNQELEKLLIVSIDLARKGLDTRSEPCQRFMREGLTVSFTKILTDEAVNSWKPNIHQFIYDNCKLLVELCVVKLGQDWFPLLDLLAILFNPNNKFHTVNSGREPGSLAGSDGEDEIFASPPTDSRPSRGWLIDLIQQFGKLNGFNVLLERFTDPSAPALSVSAIFALLRPFGLCCEYLTVRTINVYLLPCINKTMEVLEGLSDDEMKKEAKNENKNDAIASIIKGARSLVSRLPDQEETFKQLEMFRLKTILRLLQISSFNGKMSALNEVNKVIGNVSYNVHRHPSMEEEEWLTVERMTKWLKENHVLEIVLRDSLHQPQYVEKLEKMLRFIIKERALTLEDLDHVWAAQSGKHEAIVKNVHDLLAKLAWDFSPEQLDHLFVCFQSSWTNANKKQREKLLELIRRLAEDDKDGVMANKVLTLFWNLAHSDDVAIDIMDQVLAAHVKILDYSCSQERDVLKSSWLDQCVEELKTSEKWVLPALKQFREICSLYEQGPAINHSQRSHQGHFRQEVISALQKSHNLVILISGNLYEYMDKVRTIAKTMPELDSASFCPDGRYCHDQQVQDRLNFLRFLLKDGQLWLCAAQAKQIWKCLAEEGVFASDREACFKWFSKLMGEEPDLDPAINKDFFEQNILQLDPTLLTESGMKCFERFFKTVNKTEKKLIQKRRNLVMDQPDLIGMDYLWRVITNAADDIAGRAIEIMREVTTSLGPRLAAELHHLHDTFMSECLDRLRTHFDNVKLLMGQDLVNDIETNESKRMIFKLHQEAVRMCRVMKVLQEYVSKCDGDFPHERSILPLHRACRGKNICLTVRIIIHMRGPDDIDINTHANETVASLRRNILRRIKATYSGKLELSISSEGREPYILTEDKKLLGSLPIRDKMVLTAKLFPAGSAAASSPDSSSDSSTSCPHHAFDTPDVAEDMESTLPGVLLSRKQCASFFFQLSDLGCELRCPPLRDGARNLLQLIPPDSTTVEYLQDLMNGTTVSLEDVFFNKSPTQIYYCAEVLYALLMPAADPLSASAFEFQTNFIRNGHAATVLEVLTKDTFLANADVPTKRTAYVSVLKVCKLILTVAGQVVLQVENEGDDQITARLRHNVQDVFFRGLEPTLRSVAAKVSSSISDQLPEIMSGPANTLFRPAFSWSLPSAETTRSILRLAWAAATSSLASQHQVMELRAAAREGRLPEAEDVTVAREALQLLTLALALHPQALDGLITDQLWHGFVIDLVILAKNRAIRSAAGDQLLLMTALAASSIVPLRLTIALLFDQLNTSVMENQANCNEYFMLLCRLINYALISEHTIPEAEKWLEEDIVWLRSVASERGSELAVDEAVLEGRLGLARELLGFMTPEHKYDIGSNEAKGGCLVKELVEDFIFPASKQMVTLVGTRELSTEPLNAVCNTPGTISAAFDLLVALCTDCVVNMKLLVHMLTEMFYSGREKPLVEWDYLPPLGPRPPRGFVGLKNAGATCYMNSVLQQLFMVESIRTGVLAAEGAANDLSEDLGADESGELEGIDSEQQNNLTESRRDYNIGILKQIQVIFGHLACSQMQYYVPRGLWRKFRLQGEPVNLREQQDAVEFFMSLVESVDEALKALGQEQIMTKILGGSYSDQKICRGCPHRYAKEEPFSLISVDIRNHSTLLDSLEQYVKGELLEGADAYHCGSCNKKRVTVKRLCVKKLPPVLAIQLKRFEYDFDRVCAIKFNDYFEFPRDLDMDPYTVSGLAKLEGELVDCDSEEVAKEACTKYQLTGIVVHSGQASGGHYYSFMLHRLADGSSKWYKFDDGDVSEWKMDDEEEMKTQCFGGEYMGEFFDQMLKRTSYRRQKRWWNAYMLYYTRLDAINPSDFRPPKMPLAIERGVRRQNIVFMHHRNQFCPEYFQFIRRLLHCNSPGPKHQNDKLSSDCEEVSLLSVQLASRFLFHTGFHTKKALRGPALDWYELLIQHLRHFASVRRWFVVNALFQHPHRFSEYLLGSPTAEVRSAFIKILVFLAHFTLKDGPSSPTMLNHRTVMCDHCHALSDHILHALLLLLDKELSDHGRYLVHFFSLFYSYAALGLQERAQLLKFSVVETFITVALEVGPDYPDKYQYQEWVKLHQIVSLLVRCCDVSFKCQSSQPNSKPLPNPYAEYAEYVMPLPPTAVELIYVKTGYMKKLLEDPNANEESLKLIQFCCWENIKFSKEVLSECFWQIPYHCQDIKHHLDLILHLALLEDSWQSERCLMALQGVPGGTDRSEPKKGLLDITARCSPEYQKRAYQCIKCLTLLFTRSRIAYSLLTTNPENKSKFLHCVEWLQDELDRRPYGGSNQYNYNNWSPPSQLNDTNNGYILERSNSARKLLERALELCPQQEVEIEEGIHGDNLEGSAGVSGQDPATLPTHLVNANRSYQLSETESVTTERSAEVNQPEGSSSEKSNIPTFDSAMAGLTLQQTK